MRKISRRELAGMVAAVTTARGLRLEAQTPFDSAQGGPFDSAQGGPFDSAQGGPFDSAQGGPSGYIGPLTGIAERLEDRRFDPVVYSLDRYAAAPRRLRFEARTRQQAEKWQKTLRAKLIDLIGGFPSERPPLRPVKVETRDFPGFRREKIVFDSRPGVSVLAYVLIPENARTPAPTMICVPGHGRGVDDIVGIDDQGNDRTDKAGYQHDFAIQVAEAGMAAVAIEPMGFGCRRDPVNARQSLSRKACEPVAGGALLVGETMIAWRVWDVMRTVDYIATRPELDASRVGCMGISGGGTATLFSTALEPRIRAALVSGYLNTFRDSVGSLAHCIDNYVPGILNWAEMYDIAGLIAPRPLFVESGEKDNIFPIAASIESFKHVREIYSVFGAADRIEQEIFPDEHAFWGKRGVPFLARELRS
jgi:dienelactone hydrolase